VTALLARLPQVPFLLIGDDVQEDPELYANVALQHPGRVPAIWIRAVRNTRSRLHSIETLRPRLAACGTALLVAPDTASFAADATSRGWLPHRMPPSTIQPVCSHR
jgi:phosphatidate phosphatase APP1